MDILNQNDKSARPRINQVLADNKVDEDILEEYNKQFPKEFKYIDAYGEKKHTKYQISENEPDLEEE